MHGNDCIPRTHRDAGREPTTATATRTPRARTIDLGEGEEEEEATLEGPGHRPRPTASTNTGMRTPSAVLLVPARFVSKRLRVGASPLPMLHAEHRDVFERCSSHF